MKKEKSQPHDTTGEGGAGSAGSSKEGFKPSGKENKGGQAARQDGVNHKDHVNAFEVGGWKHHHSEPGEKKG